MTFPLPWASQLIPPARVKKALAQFGVVPLRHFAEISGFARLRPI
jgi:hypothetical protein